VSKHTRHDENEMILLLNHTTGSSGWTVLGQMLQTTDEYEVPGLDQTRAAELPYKSCKPTTSRWENGSKPRPSDLV